MKKEKATPTRKKTRKVEGSRKELNLKTDLGELKESWTLLLAKVW
jgi:hypothetical protein